MERCAHILFFKLFSYTFHRPNWLRQMDPHPESGSAAESCLSSCSSLGPQAYPHGRELLEYIYNQCRRLCEQFEAQPLQMDLDFLSIRYEELYGLLQRCVHNQIFSEMEDVLQSMQTVLSLLEGKHQPLHGFKPAVLRTGERGRPSWDISAEQLKFLLEFNFTVREIAHLFGVGYRTIRRRMTEYGLSVRMHYSNISNEDLRGVVSAFIQQFPDSGIKTISGYLNSVGLRVQRSRVIETLRALDPVGMLYRGLGINIIPRRMYSVPAPNALWHIDGNHKLINWRIVIHGGIDGYSRKIMYLCASNNNRASTVLHAFLTAVHQFGVPAKVRSDKGGENVDVARFMLEHPQRGQERRSFITGRSVHNQRIERLWRDVWCSVTVNYYTAFQYLNNMAIMNVDSELDLICLHYVMLPRINEHLLLFKQAWDRHRLSTEHGKSPQQLWIEGQIMGGLPFPEPECEQGDLEDYGIDWEGPTPVDPEEAVEVPENHTPLQNRVFEHLRERIDPLRPSTCFGMDILLEALESARQICHDH